MNIPNLVANDYKSQVVIHGMVTFWLISTSVSYIPFRVFMYLSMGYIHCVWMGPHVSSFSTRWTTKCVITSKQIGGIFFSNDDMVFATLSFSTFILLGSITFKQSLLKIRLKLIRDIHVSSCINVQRHKANTYYVRTW